MKITGIINISITFNSHTQHGNRSLNYAKRLRNFAFGRRYKELKNQERENNSPTNAGGGEFFMTEKILAQGGRGS